MYEDVGVKIFNKHLFSKAYGQLPISLEDDIYQSLIKRKILMGFVSNDKILDIGSHRALKKTEKYINHLITKSF